MSALVEIEADAPLDPPVDPCRADDGTLGSRIGVDRCSDATDPIIGSQGRRLQRQRKPHLVVNRCRFDPVVPGVDIGRGHTIGLGQPDPIIRFCELEVVPGLGQQVVDHVRVEGACVGKAFASIPNDTDADTAALGHGERLDRTSVHSHLGAGRCPRTHLDLLSRLCQADDPPSE